MSGYMTFRDPVMGEECADPLFDGHSRRYIRVCPTCRWYTCDVKDKFCEKCQKTGCEEWHNHPNWLETPPRTYHEAREKLQGFDKQIKKNIKEKGYKKAFLDPSTGRSLIPFNHNLTPEQLEELIHRGEEEEEQEQEDAEQSTGLHRNPGLQRLKPEGRDGAEWLAQARQQSMDEDRELKRKPLVPNKPRENDPMIGDFAREGNGDQDSKEKKKQGV